MDNIRSVLLGFAALAAAIVIVPAFGDDIDAQATVVVTGYTAYHSSVKVFFSPVPGAQDYRVYDASNPNAVKYAGLRRMIPSTTCPGQYCDKHFVTAADGVTPVYPYQIADGGAGGLQVMDVPATQIDWNNVGDGAVHTLVIEAVNMLGPVPKGSLYTGLYNTPLVLPLPVGSMPGSNKGPTDDGKTSTNGQGPYSNNPQMIARSAPFQVQVDRGYVPIPSKPTAAQTFFDTFETSQNSTLVRTARVDSAVDKFLNIGMMRYTMNANTTRPWDIEYRQADNNNSMPFIASDHFMDMLFDGGTEGSGAPGHENISSMSMIPARTIDTSGGKILHLTMEVDGHQSQRKWLAFNLSPASDPIQAWHPSGGIAANNTNQTLFLEIMDSGCTLDIYTGPAAGQGVPTGSAGGPGSSRLWGSGGAHQCNEWSMYVPENYGRNGLGFDDKSRYDLFISEARVAFFQDGRLIVQSAIPPGSFSWFSSGPVKAYFTHYVYHTVNDVDELQHSNILGNPNCYPMNAYWFNDPVRGTAAGDTSCNRAYPAGFGFRHSDERHWDNMGLEVLPANDVSSSDYSSYINLVRQPSMRPIQSITSPAPAAPSNLRIIR